jgi:hypothetical protein
MTAPVYVTRDQLKGWLKIPLNDDTKNVVVDTALDAAHWGVYNATGKRSFLLDPTPTAREFRAAGRVFCAPDGQYGILIDDAGAAPTLVEVGSVAGGWTAVTGYSTGPDNALAKGLPITSLLLGTPWPLYAPSDRLRVTVRWGWPVTPGNVPMAVNIQAGRLARRQGSPEGVLGNAEFGVVRVGRVDPDVAALLDEVAYGGFA